MRLWKFRDAWRKNTEGFEKWCEALYSRVGNLRKSSVPRVGGHFCKLVWVSTRNINEQINMFIVISEAVKTSHNLHSNNYLLSGRSRTFCKNNFLSHFFCEKWWKSKLFEIFEIDRTHKCKLLDIVWDRFLVLKNWYHWKIDFTIQKLKWCEALYSGVGNFRKSAVP